MHRNLIRAAVLGSLLVSFSAAVSGQAAHPRRPCAEIRAACEQAGFVQGGARTGDGLFVDCIAPIMRRTQPRRTSKPLPQIDLQLVAECKAQNPSFGQGNAAPSQAAPPPVQTTPLPGAPTPQEAPPRQRNAPPSKAIEPPVQARPQQPAGTPQAAPTPQRKEGGIGQE